MALFKSNIPERNVPEVASATPNDEPTKSYIVGAAKAYRNGRQYEPGEIITIPASEKPSRTWTAVPEAKPAESKQAAPGAPAKPNRPADKGL